MNTQWQKRWFELDKYTNNLTYSDSDKKDTTSKGEFKCSKVHSYNHNGRYVNILTKNDEIRMLIIKENHDYYRLLDHLLPRDDKYFFGDGHILGV